MTKVLKENLFVIFLGFWFVFFKATFLANQGQENVSLPEEGPSEITVAPQHKL